MARGERAVHRHWGRTLGVLLVTLTGCRSASNGILELTLHLPPAEPGVTHVHVEGLSSWGEWDADWPAAAAVDLPLTEAQQSVTVSLDARGALSTAEARFRIEFCGVPGGCLDPSAALWLEVERPVYRGEFTSLQIRIPEPPRPLACSEDSDCDIACSDCGARCTADPTRASCAELVCPDTCTCERGQCLGTHPERLVPIPLIADFAQAQPATDIPDCDAVRNTRSGAPTMLCAIDRCDVAGCLTGDLTGYCNAAGVHACEE